MAKLLGNNPLVDSAGNPLSSLSDINSLKSEEKISIYGSLLPPRLLSMLDISANDLHQAVHERKVRILAPTELPIVQIEALLHPDDADPIFFLEMSDTPFQQIELCFCIIRDPSAPRFDVDIDRKGRTNCFTSQVRNIPEEIRAMEAGLHPNQTSSGLNMFGELLPLVEHLTDSLGMDMIVADLLTYCNAIRYEQLGFDYQSGMRLMLAIDREFQPGGRYFQKLDGSTPFRQPGMEKTVRGRSWAIYDGILDEPWDNVQIYKIVGTHAGINTFPGRERSRNN
jgi:hypothetical protein